MLNSVQNIEIQSNMSKKYRLQKHLAVAVFVYNQDTCLLRKKNILRRKEVCCKTDCNILQQGVKERVM